LNAALASTAVSKIVLGQSFAASATVTRKVDIDLAGKTLTGNLTYNLPTATGTITLDAGTITGNLTVNTPNATFVNNATVGGTVFINNVSGNTWNENANNNKLEFNDPNANTNLVIATGKTVASLTLKTQAVVTIPATSTVTALTVATTATGATINNGGTVTTLTSNATDTTINNGQSGTVGTVNGSQAQNTEVVVNVNNANELVVALANTKNTKINLATGDYLGQFVIDRNLTLSGNGQANTTISAPAELTGTRAVLLVTNGANLSLNNLTVDGENRGGDSLYGVKLENASGSLDHVTVTGITATPFNGAQEFRAIDARAEVAGNYSLSVTNSIVNDYQKSGVYVSGLGMTAVINSNQITGKGQTEVIAQNGVTIMNGAKGTVTNNTISGHVYGNDTSASYDVLFYDANVTSTQSGNGEISFYDTSIVE